MEGVPSLDRQYKTTYATCYSGFCLGVVGPRAAKEGALSGFVPPLFRAFKNGSPRFLHVLAFLAFWAIPQDIR